jgi:threonine synthase
MEGCMRWVSTRGEAPARSFEEALVAGQAPDGGLYLPERLDPLPPDVVRGFADCTLAEIAVAVGGHVLGGDLPPDDLAAIVAEALDFPVPLVRIDERRWVLELFHGPTLAFKDVGARVQARLLRYFADGAPLTVLVATSGDTGGAVAQAFAGAPDTRVVVLYPRGQVSDIQEAQFATVGGNVTAVAVEGTFDDCQALVKRAFADQTLRRDVRLTPANSINVGRLLPQVFYYFLTTPVRRPVISVPSGNFGNLTAGLLAARLGLPTAGFVAATNRNDVVPRYLETGHYAARPSARTVANAMDVGAPSNLERMRALYDDDVARLRADVTGAAFTDAEVVAAIGDVHRRLGYLLDPHSAIAWLGLERALAAAPVDVPGVLLATAHPAKFREVVEPAIGATVPVPAPLAEAAARPRHVRPLANDYDALAALLRT